MQLSRSSIGNAEQRKQKKSKPKLGGIPVGEEIVTVKTAPS